jgi:hypothetical protein
MPSQLSRRAMIVAFGGAAGALSLAQMAAAQTTTPPQAPEDPTSTHRREALQVRQRIKIGSRSST